MILSSDAVYVYSALSTPAVFGAYLLTRGVHAGSWPRARWFFHLSWLFLYVGGMLWFYWIMPGGFDLGSACLRAGETFDTDYRSEHHGEYGAAFPLSEPCNADYDLVPRWVNLAVAGSAVLVVVGISGMATVTARRISTRVMAEGTSPVAPGERNEVGSER